jgi:hypothetical protein
MTVFQVSDFSDDSFLLTGTQQTFKWRLTPSTTLRRAKPQILTDVSWNRSAFTVLSKTVQSSWTALTLKTKAQRSFETLPPVDTVLISYGTWILSNSPERTPNLTSKCQTSSRGHGIATSVETWVSALILKLYYLLYRCCPFHATITIWIYYCWRHKSVTKSIDHLGGENGTHKIIAKNTMGRNQTEKLNIYVWSSCSPSPKARSLL